MLEIAENTLMENYSYISKIITKLRQFGFTVAMDDFGKELSSMESLTTGSFEYVKLDMLFFKNKLATEKDRVIVKKEVSAHILPVTLPRPLCPLMVF